MGGKALRALFGAFVILLPRFSHADVRVAIYPPLSAGNVSTAHTYRIYNLLKSYFSKEETYSLIPPTVIQSVFLKNRIKPENCADLACRKDEADALSAHVLVIPFLAGFGGRFSLVLNVYISNGAAPSFSQVISAQTFPLLERELQGSFEEMDEKLRKTFTYGKLYIDVIPQDAEVLLNGTPVHGGRLRFVNIPLSEKVVVNAFKENHEPFKIGFFPDSASKAVLLRIRLKRTPHLTLESGSAYIMVETDPPGAELYFDGRRISSLTPVTLSHIPEGKHEIEVRKPGYRTVRISVMGVPDVVTPLKLHLERLNYSVEVTPEPVDAEISVDDKPPFKGKSTLTFHDEDLHLIRAQRWGYTESVTVIDPLNVRHVMLRLKRYYAEVRVKSPAGGEVYLDGFKPKAKGSFYISPGKHIALLKKGSRLTGMTFQVKEGESREIVLLPGKSMAFLTVKSVPEKAQVIVNGVKAGLTPLEDYAVKPGRKVVTLIHPSRYFETITRTVFVAPGEKKEISVKLRRLSGQVSIKTYPEGANVFIDGRPSGKTPINNLSLQAGKHTLYVSKSTYLPTSHTFELLGGEEKQLSFTLTPLKKSPPYLKALKKRRAFAWAGAGASTLCLIGAGVSFALSAHYSRKAEKENEKYYLTTDQNLMAHYRENALSYKKKYRRSLITGTLLSALSTASAGLSAYFFLTEPALRVEIEMSPRGSFLPDGVLLKAEMKW